MEINSKRKGMKEEANIHIYKEEIKARKPADKTNPKRKRKKTYIHKQKKKKILLYDWLKH